MCYMNSNSTVKYRKEKDPQSNINHSTPPSSSLHGCLTPRSRLSGHPLSQLLPLPARLPTFGDRLLTGPPSSAPCLSRSSVHLAAKFTFPQLSLSILNPPRNLHRYTTGQDQLINSLQAKRPTTRGRGGFRAHLCPTGPFTGRQVRPPGNS